MQVSVEKTSELSRKMFVSVPKTVMEEKVSAGLKSLARNVKIDGFRPGKVPAHIVSKMYGERVRNEVTGDLIQSTYIQAIQDQKLNPAGYPHIHSTDADADNFNYIAEFEVYPEISLTGLENIVVQRPQAKVEDVDFDNMLLKLRQQRRTWSNVERASANSDRITLSFTGVSEGENFTDGKVENFQVEIGEGKMIPGFEDQLLGLQVGAQKTFDIQFPEEYASEKLAGKMATFDIEVINLEEAVLPEIDADFVKIYGVTSGDTEEFKSDVRANMERELKHALRDKLKNAVMDVLYSTFKFEIPGVLIKNEINHLMQPYLENAKKRKMKVEDLNLPPELFEEQAKRRVALGLILAEIIRTNQIKVDSAKVRTTVEELAQTYEDPAQVVNWYFADQKRLEDVEQMVLEEQTVEWIISKTQVQDVDVSFEAAMNREQVA